MDYEFDLPTNNNSIIKVLGVGGGGGNAVNHMFRQNIKSVDFYVCNTDKQALEMSPVPNKIQLGAKGLGAGANPEKGKISAVESKQMIKEVLSKNTEMAFITAGMGGGTGTGAAPVIAQIAREMEILTVGIVTMPFSFEGTPKMKKAEEGIKELKQHCDALLVILNERIKDVYGEMSFKKAFSQADEVLSKAAQSIADLINGGAHINVDFEDVRTVMKNAGTAVMGTATANGEKRARKAVEGAVTSPLLDNTNIKGAKYILLSIKVGDFEKLEMKELEEITKFVEEQAGRQGEVIFGVQEDESLGDALSVTIIATGFHNLKAHQFEKKVMDLDNIKAFKRTIVSPTEIDFFDKTEENTEEISSKTRPSVTKMIEKKPEKVVFELGGEYDLAEEKEADKKKGDSNELRKRVEEKKGNLGNKPIADMNNDEIKELQDLPAYMRKGVKLNEKS
jgi:cell division protein FtsZ